MGVGVILGAGIYALVGKAAGLAGKRRLDIVLPGRRIPRPSPA